MLKIGKGVLDSVLNAPCFFVFFNVPDDFVNVNAWLIALDRVPQTCKHFRFLGFGNRSQQRPDLFPICTCILIGLCTCIKTVFQSPQAPFIPAFSIGNQRSQRPKPGAMRDKVFRVLVCAQVRRVNDKNIKTAAPGQQINACGGEVQPVTVFVIIKGNDDLVDPPRPQTVKMLVMQTAPAGCGNGDASAQVKP